MSASDVLDENPAVLVEITVVVLFLIVTALLVVGPTAASVDPMFEKQPSDDLRTRYELPDTLRELVQFSYVVGTFIGYVVLRRKLIGSFDTKYD